jgi:L-lactate dehydrogenase complex protein LldG
MIDTSAARQAILSSIRGPQANAPAQAAIECYPSISRTYLRQGSLQLEQRVALFEERLIEYDARVFRVSEMTLSATIAAALGERGAAQLAIAAGTPSSWLPSGPSFVEAESLSYQQLNQVDGFVSGCTVAIALTGTIVLQNAVGQGPRRLSLIPDYHLCVVFAEQIVETVPEAFDWLAATSKLPTTFISGPSATADIEMTRIKGVHGPRFLDVLIVG